MRAFAVGAALALAGIYLEERWLTGLATVVLVAGAALRFLPGGFPRERDDAGGE